MDLSQFLQGKSFEGYDYPSVLECLLSAGGVRSDIPAMIDRLFEKFGSFKAILEAEPVQLLSVKGVSKKSATLISMIIPLARVWERSCMENPKRIRSSKEAMIFCKSLAMGERNECYHIICLNYQMQILGGRRTTESIITNNTIHPRTLVDTAINLNAHCIFICHNHTERSCEPTRGEISMTKQLMELLKPLEIILLDHIIVAGSKTYSMLAHGDIIESIATQTIAETAKAAKEDVISLRKSGNNHINI